MPCRRPPPCEPGGRQVPAMPDRHETQCEAHAATGYRGHRRRYVQQVGAHHDTGGTGVHAHRRQIAPADHAVAVDHEQRAPGDAGLLVIDAIRTRDLALWFEVGQQREVELALARQCGVAPRTVDRDRQQLRVEAGELVQQFVVQGQLVAAYRTPVGGIEREDYVAAAELFQRHALVVGGVQREFRCGGAGSKNSHGGLVLGWSAVQMLKFNIIRPGSPTAPLSLQRRAVNFLLMDLHVAPATRSEFRCDFSDEKQHAVMRPFAVFFGGVKVQRWRPDLPLAQFCILSATPPRGPCRVSVRG